GRGIVALDAVRVGAADEDVAIESEDEIDRPIQPAAAGGDESVHERPRGGIIAQYLLRSGFADEKISIRSNEQAVGTVKATVARRDKGAEESPRRTVVAHDSLVVEADNEQIDAGT